MQPSAVFKCSAERECSQMDVVSSPLTMLNDKGKCLALFTREGFFDFIVFRTPCNIAHNVAVLCQHNHKATDLLHDSMSDIKISAAGGFHSLQVFSSCDVGWFLVDNVCVNFYHCPDCLSNTIAHEQCEKHGGLLAYNILRNVSIIAPGNVLDKNSELSLFWGMLHHMDDISPSPFETFISTTNVVKPQSQITFAVNGSDLCVTLNISKQCIYSNIVLAVSYNDISFEEYLEYDYKQGNFMKDYFVSINSLNHHVPVWSVIYQPSFQMAKHRNLTLCEKPRTHTLMFTKCSDFFLRCNDGTCVHDSLVCDGKAHCQHGEDEADCRHICTDHKHSSCMSQCHHRDICSCSQQYFQCLSGGCVPLQKLCDKTIHCVDASDEPPTCVYLRPEQIGYQPLSLDVNKYINKLIQQNMVIQHGCLQYDNGIIQPVENVEFKLHSKMPTVRNARSLVTSRELPSGLQIWGKRPLNALFSVATMNADTDSAS